MIEIKGGRIETQGINDMDELYYEITPLYIKTTFNSRKKILCCLDKEYKYYKDMPIITSQEVPEGEIWFVNSKDEIMGKITGVS